MQIRHRIPTIFSIYMLDVICCALGCVVLLWQVSHQEAEQQTAAAEQARLDYEQASREVQAALSEAGQLKADLATRAEKARQLTADLERSRTLAATRLQERENLLAALKLHRAEMADLQKVSQATGAALADKEKLSADLLAQLAKMERKARALEEDVTAQTTISNQTARKLREQIALLQEAEGRGKKLERQLGELRGDAKDVQAKLTLADLRVSLLEQDAERHKKDSADTGARLKELLTSRDLVSKQLVVSARELAQARATLADLEGDKTKLEGDAARLLARARALQAAAEQRFAGIELKGENVVFMIDMSGSMALIDAQTPEPDKWPKVCEVVARLMRSLAGLQRYQVILFSDRPRYLFGHEGQWLKYDPASSAQVTLTTLKSVKPQGETNLHAAFGEAYRYRALGLDTIYLLSDGLPNAGPGLPANAADLSEAQKGEILSRSLRLKLKTEWNAVQAERPRVRIHTIGFFFESPDVGAFLWALAREHDGSFVGMSKP
jgi:hypothetical protein